MDKQFLEFWGNYLIQVAKGQQRMDDLHQWMSRGLKGFEDLTSLFRKAYGLEEVRRDHPDFGKMWKEAEEKFRESYAESLKLYGMVPRSEHLELVRKYEALKEKCADQQETIAHLKALLEAGGADQNELMRSFQELARKQGDQFQKFMESLGTLYGHGKDKDSS